MASEHTKLTAAQMGRISPEQYSGATASGIVVVLDNVRSAHNVGSAFRTADAFHADKLVLCGICAVPPSAELHKTALGAESVVPWEHYDSTLEAVLVLKSQGYRIVSVEQAEGSISLSDYRRDAVPTAFIFGNEVSGVDQQVVDASDSVLEIPQFGTKHSLNVSVTVGIVLWAALK